MSALAIAGIVVGAIVLLLVIVVFVIPWLAVRSKSRELDGKFDEREAPTAKRKRDEDF